MGAEFARLAWARNTSFTCATGVGSSTRSISQSNCIEGQIPSAKPEPEQDAESFATAVQGTGRGAFSGVVGCVFCSRPGACAVTDYHASPIATDFRVAARGEVSGASVASLATQTWSIERVDRIFVVFCAAEQAAFVETGFVLRICDTDCALFESCDTTSPWTWVAAQFGTNVVIEGAIDFEGACTQ